MHQPGSPGWCTVGARLVPGTKAMALISTAIGVGKLEIPSVVRVGFGLPGPAKYSA